MVLPEVFSIADNPLPTLAFLRSLDRAFLKTRPPEITIDHRNLKTISPEAALLLIAEYQRLKYHARYIRLAAIGLRSNPEVADILKGVGYSKYFSRDADEDRTFKSGVKPGMTFIRHAFGTKDDTEKAVELVDFFKKLVGFSERRGDRLAESIGECMINVGLHAYPKEHQNKSKWGRKRWWMLGYTDQERNEAYFAFFDQGMGISRTLQPKSKWYDFLIPPSDQDLVLTAFSRPHSRTGLEHRGRGLPTMKRYVEDAPDGELLVQANHVRISFSPKRKPVISTTQVPLAGTLLVWHVKTKDDNGSGTTV